MLSIFAYAWLSDGGGGIIFSSHGIKIMKIVLFFANFSSSLELIKIKEVRVDYSQTHSLCIGKPI